MKKLNIRFILAKNKVRVDNKAPLYCRLTLAKTRKQFATGLFILPSAWNAKTQYVNRKEDTYKELNKSLKLIEHKLNKAYLNLLHIKEKVPVDDVISKYKGDAIIDNPTLLSLFDEHNCKMEQLIGIRLFQIYFEEIHRDKNSS